MSHETAAVKKSSMPAWMILAGVLTAIAGWMTRNVAASWMHEALKYEDLEARYPDLPPIPGLKEYDGPTVANALSLGYLGLGLIIFSAALFLAGLVVIAVRR